MCGIVCDTVSDGVSGCLCNRVDARSPTRAVAHSHTTLGATVCGTVCDRVTASVTCHCVNAHRDMDASLGACVHLWLSGFAQSRGHTVGQSVKQ